MWSLPGHLLRVTLRLLIVLFLLPLEPLPFHIIRMGSLQFLSFDGYIMAVAIGVKKGNLKYNNKWGKYGWNTCKHQIKTLTEYKG